MKNYWKIHELYDDKHWRPDLSKYLASKLCVNRTYFVHYLKFLEKQGYIRSKRKEHAKVF